MNYIPIACILASYEMDEPHVNMPDLDVGDESKQFYPDITEEKFLGWLAEPHCGDCTGLPAPCIRCYADCIQHKALFIVDQLYKKHDL